MTASLSASDDLLRVDRASVTTLTLNRPEQLNAFTYVMYARLIDLLEQARHDSAVRVLILTGAGRGFCAGHDLRSAGEPAWTPRRAS